MKPVVNYQTFGRKSFIIFYWFRLLSATADEGLGACVFVLKHFFVKFSVLISRVFAFFTLSRSVTLHSLKTAIFNFAKSVFWSAGRAKQLGWTWAFNSRSALYSLYVPVLTWFLFMYFYQHFYSFFRFFLSHIHF